MLTIRGLVCSTLSMLSNVACWVSIGTRDVPSRPTSLTSGGLGDQVTKALKLEGLLCTERLVVRATSAP
jgi:hypothetical protein